MLQLEENSGDKPLKRKHITLTIQEKLDIIDLVESNTHSRQFIANLYGIGKSTVHDIHKRRDQIRKFADTKKSDLSKRRRLDVGLEIKIEEPERFIVEQLDVTQNDDELSVKNEEEFTLVFEEEVLWKSQVKKRDGLKRRSNTLTIRQKYEILKQLEEGMSVPSICSKYAIGRTTVYDFIKRKQEIINYIEKSSDETRKTFKKSNYPVVEDNMKRWCESQEVFTKQDFFENCKVNFSRVKNSSHFCGSWNWCKRFFDRHPQFKAKLVKNNGEPLDKSELNITKAEESEFHLNTVFQLEEELLQWCLLQEKELSIADIAEAAQDLSFGQKNNFNPTQSWVEKFLQRHSEIFSIERVTETETISEEEYIVEELDESSQDESMKIEEIIEEEVNEVDAVNSLSTLLRFSQQRGIRELENLLFECKDLILNTIEIS